MPASAAVVAANRRNAERSTGPRTASGKARSRRNALKHGLTGAGVAVPDEDSSAIQERFEAFEADLKPKDSVGQFVVHRAAMLSVRLERCVRHESAELTRDMLRAEQAEADDRAEDVARAVASMADDPAEAVRKLRRSPEGIDWMIRSWEGLKADLTHPSPNRRGRAQFEQAERLAGRVPEHLGDSRVVALSNAIDGNFRFLDRDDWPDLPPADRREAARAAMGALIDAEVARLRRDRDGLDHEAIAREHATAPARALFGTSKEAILARKYEAAAEREFYRALKQVEHLNAQAEADDRPGDLDANPDEVNGCRESGSFFPGADAGAEVEPSTPRSGQARRELPPDRPENGSGPRPGVGPRPASDRLVVRKTPERASPAADRPVIGVSPP